MARFGSTRFVGSASRQVTAPFGGVQEKLAVLAAAWVQFVPLYMTSVQKTLPSAEPVTPAFGSLGAMLMAMIESLVEPARISEPEIFFQVGFWAPKAPATQT